MLRCSDDKCCSSASGHTAPAPGCGRDSNSCVGGATKHDRLLRPARQESGVVAPRAVGRSVDD